MADNWEKAKQIFADAIRLSPELRLKYLNEACADDDATRREVESLLSSYDDADSFMEKPAAREVADVIHQAKNLEPGKCFGHYEIIEQIGAGGIGEVYLARDKKLDRKVAVKILKEKFSRHESNLQRFNSEAKAVSALNHPNILVIHEIGESEETHYIISEYIEGKTLREIFKEKTLKLIEILDVSIQIASALAVAHEAYLVHRDIKPENIMVRSDGVVKILDFGLAKLLKPKMVGLEESTLQQNQTAKGIILGTVNYMSPEQARGLKVDNRTDIWSFGVLLYELFARRVPFTGETTTDVILSIIEKKPPDLQNIAPDLPHELYFIVNKLLRKKLEERYQSIKDVLADLRRVKQKLDYEEIERSISPEDAKTRTEREQRETEVLAAVASDSKESISTNSSENLPPNNLSTELSPLIGRQTELEEIEGLLKQHDIRLLTITGVGGTGKTRLAQAIARTMLSEFTDGVYFISLSAIENPELAVPIIAYTLGVREESGKPLNECLLEFLYLRKMLIILDSFEQIVEAAPQIGELLSGSINLKILVTSRTRLQLSFEREFVLQPLEVPVEENLSISELNEYSAIKFFVERARAVKPAFALSEDNAQSIAEICRRLDGLPLAIELAAARVKLLAPRAILTRLSKSLKLLTGGARDLPERQQTMRGAIAWSYDLLEEEEKKLFKCLAVFSGGFTLEAAEAIANAKEDLSVDLLDAVASLVDKSLILQREQSDGDPHFRMLTVVREFALDALEESGKANQIKRLHAEFYALLAETVEPELMAAKGAQWLETLEQEYDNLRSAIEWSLENEPEIALRIVGVTHRFWVSRGYLSEGFKWTKQALEKNGEEADPKLRAKAYFGISDLGWRQGNLEGAEPFSKKSLRLAREIGDKQLISTSLGGVGNVKFLKGDLMQGKSLFEESLAIARELNDRTIISIRLNDLGDVSREQQDYEAAQRYYEEALTVVRQQSLKILIPSTTFNLASVACLLGDYQSALSYALESLKFSEDLRNKIGIGLTLNIFAALAVKVEKMEKAARLYGAAQAIYDAKGYNVEKVDREFANRYMGEARAAIGDEAFEAAFKEGQSMRLKDAIALARKID